LANMGGDDCCDPYKACKNAILIYSAYAGDVNTRSVDSAKTNLYPCILRFASVDCPRL